MHDSLIDWLYHNLVFVDYELSEKFFDSFFSVLLLYFISLIVRKVYAK